MQASEFLSKIDRSAGVDGCWRYRQHDGYPTVRIDGTTVKGHRLIWSLENGAIPQNHFICHHCDNPWCLNPSHLFAGTAQDNMNDARAKGRLGGWRKKHEYGPTSLIDVRETARLLSVRPAKVYEMVRASKGPPHIRIGSLIKFRRQSVEAWLEEQEK